jgi:phosphoserine aminotransferase
MNEITRELLVSIETAEGLGERVTELAHRSDTIKQFSRKLRALLVEILPNSSVKVRGLFSASDDVPVIYANLLRAALYAVKWKALAREIAEKWEIDHLTPENNAPMLDGVAEKEG